MGYYIRVLGKTNPTITVDKLNETLEQEDLQASIEIQEGVNDSWTELVVKDKDNRDLFVIGKNEVIDGGLGQAEIEEFKEEVIDCKPTSATHWLLEYFEKVRVVYAFQILDTVVNDESSRIVGEVKSKIWNETKGIVQADNEGFTNEAGYHILWQFSDTVTGPWYMAVKDSDDNWVNFRMDLGNKKQRQEFLEGRVPKRVELV